MKLDMHCHTKEGSPDGKTPLLENIAALKAKGYNGMLITDHNSYKAYKYYKKLKNKPKDFTVLCGIEYDTLDAGHILIIMPTGLQPRIFELRGLPVIFLIELVHRMGGILGPAHPCGEKFLSIFNTKIGKRTQEKLMTRFDFIETYNACEDENANAHAKALAVKYNLPEMGGSDSHKPDSVGFGYTLLQKNVANESELIKYIKSGSPVTSGGTRYFYTTKQKLGKANNILVYSFWFYNKFMALFRSKPRKRELTKSILTRQPRYHKVKYITLS
ncbi:MAG: CehA/McbA family metallohydrolase [Clostridiales bacterium]|nr:CehA/McbA family metallohydrolase [Clostridiales bacterium]